MSHHHPHHNSRESRHITSEPQDPARAPVARGELPLAERIRVRAYEISQARIGGQGNPVEDWVQAEQELGAKLSGKR